MIELFLIIAASGWFGWYAHGHSCLDEIEDIENAEAELRQDQEFPEFPEFPACGSDDCLPTEMPTELNF